MDLLASLGDDAIQAAYLVEQGKSLASSGYQPVEFQTVLNTAKGSITIPCVAKTTNDELCIIYSYKGLWDNNAEKRFVQWLNHLRTFPQTSSTIVVVLTSNEPTRLASTINEKHGVTFLVSP